MERELLKIRSINDNAADLMELAMDSAEFKADVAESISAIGEVIISLVKNGGVPSVTGIQEEIVVSGQRVNDSFQMITGMVSELFGNMLPESSDQSSDSYDLYEDNHKGVEGTRKECKEVFGVK